MIKEPRPRVPDYRARVDSLARWILLGSIGAQVGSALLLWIGTYWTLLAATVPAGVAGFGGIVAAVLCPIVISIHWADLAWPLRAHVRRVLLDKGVLSLVLLDDGGSRLTSMHRRRRLLELPLSRKADQDVVGRLQTLATRYEGVCRELGIEAYPPRLARTFQVMRAVHHRMPLGLIAGAVIVTGLMLIYHVLVLLWAALAGLALVLAAIVIAYDARRSLLVIRVIQQVLHAG